MTPRRGALGTRGAPDTAASTASLARYHPAACVRRNPLTSIHAYSGTAHQENASVTTTPVSAPISAVARSPTPGSSTAVLNDPSMTSSSAMVFIANVVMPLALSSEASCPAIDSFIVFTCPSVTVVRQSITPYADSPIVRRRHTAATP